MPPQPYASSSNALATTTPLVARQRRPRRIKRTPPSSLLTSFVRKSSSGLDRHKDDSDKQKQLLSPFLRLLGAIALWYTLGIVSISTTKILLQNYHVPPLVLTLQQFLCGSTLLRVLLSLQSKKQPSKIYYSKKNSDLIQYDGNDKEDHDNCHKAHDHQEDLEAGNGKNDSTTTLRTQDSSWYWWRRRTPQQLYSTACGLCFTFGFYWTNVGFQLAPASFVETIKAAEPLTSATLVVAVGLETLNWKEWTSLGWIVGGVLVSTTSSSTTSSSSASSSFGASTAWCCVIVMASNLCFSGRGLFQKWMGPPSKTTANKYAGKNDKDNNSKPQPKQHDATQLQYQMQQLGAQVMLVPAALLLLYMAIQYDNIILHPTILVAQHSSTILHYVGLAIVNGTAFTSYNLASTYILSRLSVVHHAALNCLRRIFAIGITSLLFGVPITYKSASGISMSILGFLALQHFKHQKQQKKVGDRPTASFLRTGGKQSRAWSSTSSCESTESTTATTTTRKSTALS